MSERLQKILEYEKQLMESREKLIELIAEGSDGQDDQQELLDYKLVCFQKEIGFLNRQVELLKKGAIRQNENVAQERKESAPSENIRGAGQEVEVPIDSGEQNVEKPVSVSGRTQADEKTFSKAGNTGVSSQTVKEGPKSILPGKKDLEKTIGKSLMGIFASVLIFISLILFATLLLPYFNDTAKMITTYIVSFVFLGVGVVKLKKDPDNKLFTALTGCGMGSLYISLLLSNMYFKVLGDIPLYVLIAIWGIGVSIFAKKNNKIFQVIGELGILISMIFGCYFCKAEYDGGKFWVLVVYYVISSGVFYFLHYEKEFNRNLLHHICNVITMIALTTTMFDLMHSTRYVTTLGKCFFLGVILASFFATFTHKQEKEGVSFGIFSSIYLILAYIVLDGMCGSEKMFCILLYFTAIPLLGLYEWKKTEHVEGKVIGQILVLFMGILGFFNWSEVLGYGAVPMLVLPLLAAGYLLKNPLYKYGSLVTMFIYLILFEPIGAVGHFLMCLLAVVSAYAVMYLKKEQYSEALKNILYVYSLLAILTCLQDVVFMLCRDYEWEEVVPFLVLVVYNTIMSKCSLAKNLQTGEPEKPTIYNIVNLLLMVWGLWAIGDGYDGLAHFLLIVFTLIAFLVNSRNLLEKRNNLFAGIYVGVKFTVFIIVVLNSFEAVNYVISIACLFLAIAGIILGFAGEYKALRIFGLILSMISIFKLIMIDISYENTLGHALSFFVSGILCFVISLIYNYIDKKLQQRA